MTTTEGEETLGIESVEEAEAREAAEEVADREAQAAEPPVEIVQGEEAGAEAAPESAATEPETLSRLLESLLFVSPEPMSPKALAEALGVERADLAPALERLKGRLAEGRSGIVVCEVAGAYQLRSAVESAPYVRRLLGVKPQRLTRAALETLAFVAYRQPVTRAEVEEIRGVDCGAVLKALLERKLVRILGKKEELGRPLLYGTTREFLEFFGLDGLGSLPTLREFQELSEENRSIVEEETGAPAPIQGIADLADAALARRLDELAPESEEALGDLEAAMEEAEARAKLVHAQLEPQAAEAEAEAAKAPAEA